MMDRLIEHLAMLVSCDTRNPPRAITTRDPIFRHIEQALPDFEVRLIDHGNGRISQFALRGKPSGLFNVHLDTVPASDRWRRDPLDLKLEDDRAYGLGACDIKGAAAALLVLAQQSDVPLALLFTTDEEGANGCCVSRFCESELAQEFSFAVVAEPTGCQARISHRGYLSVIGTFEGIAGHSSEERALRDNSIHAFAKWAQAAIQLAEGERPAKRSCFNIGRVEGGQKSNVIADALEVRWSARLPAGIDSAAYAQKICALADANWHIPLDAPSLPAQPQHAEQASELAARCQIPIADPVDFWTEASLFSAAGIPALVLGPGNIREAHTADEWVAISHLETVLGQYRSLAMSFA